MRKIVNPDGQMANYMNKQAPDFQEHHHDNK